MSATTPSLHRHAVQATTLSISLGEFAERQRAIDRDLFRKTLKMGLELPTPHRFEKLIEGLGLESNPQLVADFTRIHMGMLHDAVSVPAYHEPILSALSIEHKLAVCSNFSHAETARLILDEAGFSNHLSSIVISDELGIRKPRPEIFEAVAASIDLAPSEILHVGDSLESDVAGAAACGMRTVWLTRQIADPDAKLEAYDGPAPDFALDGLMDLPVLVARLSV